MVLNPRISTRMRKRAKGMAEAVQEEEEEEEQQQQRKSSPPLPPLVLLEGVVHRSTVQCTVHSTVV